MKTVSFPKNSPFDDLTGDLLPDYRDAYLRGQLTPVPTQKIEAYLSQSPIQKSMLLGRYHELSAQATETGRTLVPPRWVQLQLQRQASYSAAGPLRQPLIRGVLGVLAVLCLASGVQWMRNEPLLPAPVAAAVQRVAASAQVATRQLVQRFTTTTAEEPTALVPRRAVRAVVAPRPRTTVAAPAALEVRPVAISALSPDSLLAQAVPSRLATSAATDAESPAQVVVYGRISDTGGHQLPGATVLGKGTQLATSANENGEYTLTVPVGTTLLFGYGGCLDQALPAINGALDVTLAPVPKADRRAR